MRNYPKRKKTIKAPKRGHKRDTRVLEESLNKSVTIKDF